MRTIQVFMEMFQTKYHCQSFFFKVRIKDMDLDAKATSFSIPSSCTETTPPQLCKEMYQKPTIAASKNHNGLMHWMIA